MARLTFSAGEALNAAKLNAAMDELYAWQANANANNKNLSSLGVVTFGAAGYINSALGIGALPAGSYMLDVTHPSKGTRCVWTGSDSASNTIFELKSNANFRMYVRANGAVGFPGTPTSSAGLASGEIYRDAAAGNVLKMVP